MMVTPKGSCFVFELVLYNMPVRSLESVSRECHNSHISNNQILRMAPLPLLMSVRKGTES